MSSSQFPPDNLPIGERDTPVRLNQSRDKFLPTLYRAFNHPLLKDFDTAYYFIIDGSPGSMKDIYTFEDKVNSFPQTETEACNQGFLKLLPGEILFEHMSTASSSGMDDVAVFWVMGRNELPADIVARSTAMRDSVLGARNLRDRNAPKRDGADMVGGTRFERVFPPGQNLKNGRSYGHGTSYEIPSCIFSPAAQGKIDIADSDTLALRRELLWVSTCIAMKAIQKGPSEISESLRLNSEIFNLPSVGVDGNTAFTSYQINLAPVRPHESNETLGETLGHFGEAHIDERDSPSHYTAVTVFSDLPTRFDPGRIFLAYPGVFCSLDYLTTAIFSGTRRHGSSPPIASLDASVDELQWATRFINVCYGGTGPTQSYHKRPICIAGVASGTGKASKKALLFNITPEMMQPNPQAEDLPRASHSTFVREGPTIMSPRSLMTFLCRSLLMFVVYTLSQLSSSVGARVDSDAFLAAFSYIDDQGARVSLDPWESGPGWRMRRPDNGDAGPSSESANQLVDQKETIARNVKRWDDYCKKYAGHLPYAVACIKDVLPLEGWFGDDVPVKLPSLHPSGTNGVNGKKKPAPKKASASKPAGVNSSTAATVAESASVWEGVDKRLLEKTLASARAGTAEYPIDLDRESDSDSAMDVSDDARRAGIPSYLKSITPRTVHEELLLLQNSMIALETAETYVDRSSTARIIRGFHSAICDRPLEAQSFQHIQSAWIGVLALSTHVHENAFHSRMRQASIMLANYAAWNWLESSIPRALRDMNDNLEGAHLEWLTQLAAAVRTSLAAGHCDVSFAPEQYGIILEDASPACLDLSNCRYTPARSDLLVTSTIQDILAKWLHFPTQTNNLYKARFVGAIIRFVGYKALVLDCVWRKCKMAQRYYFRKYGPLPVLNTATSSQFPILDADSSLRKEIREIYSLINAVLGSHSDDNSLVGHKSGRLQGTLESRLNIFRNFISDCYRLSVEGLDLDNAALQILLAGDADYTLPFRKLAPSRIHSLAPGSPYDPSNLCTFEGIFSAIVGRAITFNSSFSRDSSAPTMFNSPEDFIRSTVNLPLEDYCNISAYGPKANKKKEPDLVFEYWDSLGKVDWKKFTTDKMTFRRGFNFFRPAKDAKFRELGPLGAYLLAVDYTYAGLLQWPDVEEMGKMVHFINKGPVAAFKLLGLIPPRPLGQHGNKLKADEAACISAFTRIHDVVMSSLPEDKARQAGLDIFVTEHALCKFNRAKDALGL